MPIAFDDSTDGGLAFATTLNYNHTCTGSDRLLIVGVFESDTPTTNITSVTYNGVSMSFLGQRLNGLTDRLVTLWGLLAPATGSNTVAITASATDALYSQCSSFTGVSQSGLPDSVNTGQSSTPLTVNTTVVAANCWLAGTLKDDNGSGVSFTGATEREAAAGLHMFDSNGTVGTGSQGVTGTMGGGQMAMVLISIAPVGGGGGGDEQPMMRRWGASPFVGGQGVNRSGGNSGKMWGRRRSGLVVPERFREAA